MVTAIAHYNLLELLGEGGLGPVYRARDTRIGRTVALKVVPLSAFPDPEARARFFNAAAAAGKLSHPNIATLFDVGEHDGGAYLAYEFTPGTTIREEVAGHAGAPRRSVELATHVADALADGHANGIIHGDVRPDNIVVTPKGSAKLLEFGLSPWTRAGGLRARAAESPDPLGADSLGVVAYMSPEQALGGPVDARTDIFSLGVVLYEMLTGRHPFAGAGAAATVMNIIQTMPPPPSTVTASVPKEIDAILGRALAKDIAQRQQSAASLSAELRSIGAMLDVRAGQKVESDLLIPIDDEGISPATVAGIIVAMMIVAAIVWYFTR